MRNLLLLYFIFILSFTYSQLTVYEPAEIRGTYPVVHSPFLGLQGDFNYSANLVFSDPKDGCSPFKNADEMTGNIAVVFAYSCSGGTKATFAEEAGAIAILVLQPVRSQLGDSGYNNGYKKEVNIPFLDLQVYKNFPAWKDLSSQENVTIEANLVPQGNLDADERIWAPFSAIFLLISTVLLVGAGYKLYFYLNTKLIFLPVTILVIEVIANMLRLVFFLEPGGLGRGIFTQCAGAIFFTVSWPFEMASTLLLALYWQEMMSRFERKSGMTQKMITGLGAMKWPACIAIGLLMLLFIAQYGLSCEYVAGIEIIIYLYGIMDILIAFINFVFFSANGIRVLMFLHRNKASTTHSEAIRRLTILTGINGLGWLTYMIGAIATIFVITAGEPEVIVTAYAIMFGGLKISSCSKILVFKTNVEITTSSGSGMHGTPTERGSVVV